MPWPELCYFWKHYTQYNFKFQTCSQRAVESTALLVHCVLGMRFKTSIHMIYSLVDKVHLLFLLL